MTVTHFGLTGLAVSESEKWDVHLGQMATVGGAAASSGPSSSTGSATRGDGW